MTARLVLLCATLFAAGLFALPAGALLLSGQDIIAAPASVADDAPGAENDHQQAFNEAQGVTLTSDLGVDGGTIAMGTVVDSHMIFLNSPGSRDILDSNVMWSFYGDILGIMSDRNGTLEAASNAMLAAAGTFYPGGFAARGLEGGGDGYTFSGNTITVSMHVTEPGDWIRVVTAAAPIPEPASLLLLGSGLLGLAGYRRRATRR